MKDIKVLIVEDERIIAEDMKRILLKYNYKVVAISSTGEEAIAAAEKYKPDVILMDIVLEGSMSGITASRNINKIISIPIIYTTSYLDKKSLGKIKNLESYAYLMKPFEDKELYATIELAVYKFRMESLLLDYKNKIEKLHEIATQMAGISNKEEIFRVIKDSISQMLGFDQTVIFKKSDNINDFEVISSNSPLYLTADRVSFPVEMVGRVNEEVVITYDLCSSEKMNFPVHSNRSVMIMKFDRVGVILVFSKTGLHFSENDQNVIGLLLRHASVDIKRMQLQEELRVKAVIDPMTGCYNRFYLFTALDLEVKKAKRIKNSIAFLMVDVNGLKKINDQYGHAEGDKLLIAVANILREASRETDVVVRYGGDEFLIMMPDTMLEAEIVMNRIKERAKNWNCTNKDCNYQVSFAMGCAYWQTGSEYSIEDTLALADERMYNDKKNYHNTRK